MVVYRNPRSVSSCMAAPRCAAWCMLCGWDWVDGARLASSIAVRFVAVLLPCCGVFASPNGFFRQPVIYADRTGPSAQTHLL